MEIRVLGLMSGSSLDGLDLADCLFNLNGGSIHYKLIRGITIPNSPDLVPFLKNSSSLSSQDLFQLNSRYGHWIGQSISQNFDLSKYDLIACHGHTALHEPSKGFSLQLGDANAISAECGIPVIADFRNADISQGGQGAPLVPKGEIDLFPNYQGFINLGGISNITVNKEKVIGFDISIFNMALNDMANLNDKPFDKGGQMAASGQIITDLLQYLNTQDYYNQKAPKSLDRNWYEKNMKSILIEYSKKHSINDILNTLVEHFAIIISEVINKYFSSHDEILISGGGAYNVFFINSLREKSKAKISIPPKELIDYKEAVIFAYLGLLRLLGKDNSLASVTGASKNTCGGSIYGNDKNLKTKLNVGLT